MSSLILKRASASRSSGQWRDDDYDVLEGGTVVGRPAAPEGRRWMWTLAYGYHKDRTPTHGYEPMREAAMARSPRGGDGNRPALPLARPAGGSNRVFCLLLPGTLP